MQLKLLTQCTLPLKTYTLNYIIILKMHSFHALNIFEGFSMMALLHILTETFISFLPDYKRSIYPLH